jgi:hypothetical protein
MQILRAVQLLIVFYLSSAVLSENLHLCIVSDRIPQRAHSPDHVHFYVELQTALDNCPCSDTLKNHETLPEISKPLIDTLITTSTTTTSSSSSTTTTTTATTDRCILNIEFRKTDQNILYENEQNITLPSNRPGILIQLYANPLRNITSVPAHFYQPENSFYQDIFEISEYNQRCLSDNSAFSYSPQKRRNTLLLRGLHFSTLQTLPFIAGIMETNIVILNCTFSGYNEFIVNVSSIPLPDSQSFIELYNNTFTNIPAQTSSIISERGYQQIFISDNDWFCPNIGSELDYDLHFEKISTGTFLMLNNTYTGCYLNGNINNLPFNWTIFNTHDLTPSITLVDPPIIERDNVNGILHWVKETSIYLFFTKSGSYSTIEWIDSTTGLETVCPDGCLDILLEKGCLVSPVELLQQNEICILTDDYRLSYNDYYETVTLFFVLWGESPSLAIERVLTESQCNLILIDLKDPIFELTNDEEQLQITLTEIRPSLKFVNISTQPLELKLNIIIENQAMFDTYSEIVITGFTLTGRELISFDDNCCGNMYLKLYNNTIKHMSLFDGSGIIEGLQIENCNFINTLVLLNGATNHVSVIDLIYLLENKWYFQSQIQNSYIFELILSTNQIELVGNYFQVGGQLENLVSTVTGVVFIKAQYDSGTYKITHNFWNNPQDLEIYPLVLDIPSEEFITDDNFSHNRLSGSSYKFIVVVIYESLQAPELIAQSILYSNPCISTEDNYLELIIQQPRYRSVFSKNELSSIDPPRCVVSSDVNYPETMDFTLRFDTIHEAILHCDQMTTIELGEGIFWLDFSYNSLVKKRQQLKLVGQFTSSIIYVADSLVISGVHAQYLELLSIKNTNLIKLDQSPLLYNTISSTTTTTTTQQQQIIPITVELSSVNVAIFPSRVQQIHKDFIYFNMIEIGYVTVENCNITSWSREYQQNNCWTLSNETTTIPDISLNSTIRSYSCGSFLSLLSSTNYSTVKVTRSQFSRFDGNVLSIDSPRVINITDNTFIQCGGRCLNEWSIVRIAGSYDSPSSVTISNNTFDGRPLTCSNNYTLWNSCYETLGVDLLREIQSAIWIHRLESNSNISISNTTVIEEYYPVGIRFSNITNWLSLNIENYCVPDTREFVPILPEIESLVLNYFANSLDNCHVDGVVNDLEISGIIRNRHPIVPCNENDNEISCKCPQKPPNTCYCFPIAQDQTDCHNSLVYIHNHPYYGKYYFFSVNDAVENCVVDSRTITLFRGAIFEENLFIYASNWTIESEQFYNPSIISGCGHQIFGSNITFSGIQFVQKPDRGCSLPLFYDNRFIQNDRNISFADCIFDGNSAPYPAIAFKQINNLLLDRCTISNFETSTRNDYLGTISIMFSNQTSIINCNFERISSRKPLINILETVLFSLNDCNFVSKVETANTLAWVCVELIPTLNDNGTIIFQVPQFSITNNYFGLESAYETLEYTQMNTDSFIALNISGIDPFSVVNLAKEIKNNEIIQPYIGIYISVFEYQKEEEPLNDTFVNSVIHQVRIGNPNIINYQVTDIVYCEYGYDTFRTNFENVENLAITFCVFDCPLSTYLLFSIGFGVLGLIGCLVLCFFCACSCRRQKPRYGYISLTGTWANLNSGAKDEFADNFPPPKPYVNKFHKKT